MTSNRSGFELAATLTNDTDNQIKELASGLPQQKGWALLALGGYGRRQLCPHSDLDLLILFERKVNEEQAQQIIDQVIYPLWDLKKDASHSVRSVRQALSDQRSDFFLRTALLSARHICGSKNVHEKLVRGLRRKLSKRELEAFLKEMRHHNQERSDNAGDSTYLLEPNLKEGRGGLRDYQSILWLGRTFYGTGSIQRLAQQDLISQADGQELTQAADTLLMIRHHLHRLTGRRTDQVFIEHQEPLAAAIYGGASAENIEKLMQLIHNCALTIRTCADIFFSQAGLSLKSRRQRKPRAIDEDFEILDEQLNFCDPEYIRELPVLLFEIFLQLGIHNLPLHSDARRFVREHLEWAVERVSQANKNRIFLQILSSPHPEIALVSMLESGMLEAMLPEFSHIKGRTQFDQEHVYTIDHHSIRTLGELTKLKQSEFFAAVNDKSALYLAALLHDIGKGRQADHSETGAEIVFDIAQRLGFSSERARLIRHLVRHHLTMADRAINRDLSEENTVIDFAQCIKTPEWLAMLRLLTEADSRATGPALWNDWKETLLNELYYKSLHVLRCGLLKDARSIVKLDERWEELLAKAPRHRGRFWSLPQSYILAFKVDDILRHLELSDQIENENELRIEVSSEDEFAMLTIISRNRPGLFALLSGILALNNMDIISARVFSWLNGMAVDEFRVCLPWKGFREWERIQSQFRDILNGKINLSERISTKQARLKPVHARTAARVVVGVDNDTSNFFSLIHIGAPDRLGLLYRISEEIGHLELGIHRAFIMSRSGRAEDIFYVVDKDGEKIWDETMQIKITATLKQAIDAISQ